MRLQPTSTFKPGMPAIGAEFELTNNLINIARGINTSTQPLTINKNAATPFSNAVFNIIAKSTIGQEEGLNAPALDNNLPHLLLEVPRSLNISTPVNAPSIITEDGLYIYNANPQAAYRILKVKEEFPNV